LKGTKPVNNTIARISRSAGLLVLTFLIGASVALAQDTLSGKYEGTLKTAGAADEKVSLELRPSAGTRVYYTTDGSIPDEKSTVYDKPIEIALGEREPVTLKTVVINAAGRKGSVYASTVIRDKMREPLTLGETKPGVAYEVVIPRPDGMGEGGRKTGESRSISLNQFANQGIDLKQPFAVTFDGYFRVPTDGVYEFQVDSTWDTTLVLAGGMIIDDAGTKDRKVRSSIIPLKAGLHKISVRYNHRGGDAAFRFRWGIKGQGLRQAGGGEFVH